MKKGTVFFVVCILLISAAGVTGKILSDHKVRCLTQELADLKGIVATLQADITDLQGKVADLEKSFPVPVVGVASWYGNWEERAGSKTANGEVFRKDGYTVAHRTLPFGTILLIENVENGRIVPAVVNDRGPYIEGREIDLTEGLAKRLGFIQQGLVEVRYFALFVPDASPFGVLMR